MRRLGLVGIENSHTEHVLHHLNRDARRPGWRLTHVQALGTGRDDAIRAEDPDVVLVPDLAAFVGDLDAVVVCDRDGARHPDHAAPFLRHGTPVLVDKPLATSVAGVDAVLAAATEGGVPVVSHSALRFTDGWRALAARCAERGAPDRLRLTGPADPASPYGGVFFYGIHLADPACTVLTADPGRPAVVTGPTGVVVRAQAGPTTLELHLLPPEGPARFHAAASWGDATEEGELVLGPDYVAPALDDFFAVAAGEREPEPADRLRRPIALLEAVQQALTTEPDRVPTEPNRTAENATKETIR